MDKLNYKQKRNKLEEVFRIWNIDLYDICPYKEDHESFKADIINALCKASEPQDEALILKPVSFSEAECKHEFVSREYMNQPNGTCLQCGAMIP